jgi:ribose 5-phosphate isomerase B
VALEASNLSRCGFENTHVAPGRILLQRPWFCTAVPGEDERSWSTIRPVKIALGADHVGVRLKDTLKRLLDAVDIAHADFGTSSDEAVDYPDFAERVAHAVARGEFDRGILVCGSGIGMAMAANKVAGIRAAVGSDVRSAQLCRQHNDANILTLGARLTTDDQAADIVRAFLSSEFEGGRHVRRVEKIRRIESSRAS